MVVELIGIAAAIVGSFAAGIWDLKTTDVPDEITTIMGVLGIIIWTINLGITGAYMPLVLSVALGTGVLLFGWVLYRAGQWGGGDAKLFAAIFYLIPSVAFLFDYIINLLFVAIAYLVVYSLVLGFRHPAVFAVAYHNLGMKRQLLAVYAALIVVGAPLAAFLGYNPVIGAAYWLVGLGLLLFWAYARAIEKGVFHRTIPASKLRVGDVLASYKRWEGVTEAEVARIKKTKKVVKIKEGVRFTMVFALNILVTLLIGNIAYLVF